MILLLMMTNDSTGVEMILLNSIRNNFLIFYINISQRILPCAIVAREIRSCFCIINTKVVWLCLDLILFTCFSTIDKRQKFIKSVLLSSV